MTWIKVYSLLFLTLFIFISLATIASANDAEIDALRKEIASLEDELDSLSKTKAKKELDLEDERQSLTNIQQNIANADRYIASAKENYDAADNDAERADWAAVIEDLEDYRQSEVYRYNSVSYTIELLESDIKSLKNNIDAVERKIKVANARLAELLDN